MPFYLCDPANTWLTSKSAAGVYEVGWIELLCGSQLLQKIIIISVRTDPEPYNSAVLLYPNCAVILGDAQGEDWPCRMYPLEMETGMVGVTLESLVRILRFFSYLLR